jgi:hypothetical protein
MAIEPDLYLHHQAFPVSSIPNVDDRVSLKHLRQLSLNDDDVKSKSPRHLANIDPKISLDKLSSKKRNAKPSRRTSGSALGTNSTSPPGSVSLSDSDSESEHESSDEEDDEESPLPAKRPNDPSGALNYDVIQAVWRPSSRYLANDDLFARISEFSELFWKVRDDWKKSNDTLKSAVEKKSSQIDSFKHNVSKQRQILEVALNAALKHGHPEILQT